MNKDGSEDAPIGSHEYSLVPALLDRFMEALEENDYDTELSNYQLLGMLEMYTRNTKKGDEIDWSDSKYKIGIDERLMPDPLFTANLEHGNIKYREITMYLNKYGKKHRILC